jgi:hypothetical protein
MNQSEAEVLILAINALGAGILMFVAGVVQKIMDELDELDFKRFLNLLGQKAMADPFAVTVATLPIIAAVLYFLAYGFGHWWFTAGFIAWLVGSSITKVTNMPVYEWVADPRNTDPAEFRNQRRKLKLANNARAWITLTSVILMACQFGVSEALLVTAAAVIIAFPLLWVARKYTPGTAGTSSG